MTVVFSIYWDINRWRNYIILCKCSTKHACACVKSSLWCKVFEEIAKGRGWYCDYGEGALKQALCVALACSSSLRSLLGHKRVYKAWPQYCGYLSEPDHTSTLTQNDLLVSERVINSLTIQDNDYWKVSTQSKYIYHHEFEGTWKIIILLHDLGYSAEIEICERN